MYEIFRISEIPQNLARISGFLVGFPRISGFAKITFRAFSLCFQRFRSSTNISISMKAHLGIYYKVVMLSVI